MATHENNNYLLKSFSALFSDCAHHIKTFDCDFLLGFWANWNGLADCSTVPCTFNLPSPCVTTCAQPHPQTTTRIFVGSGLWQKVLTLACLSHRSVHHVTTAVVACSLHRGAGHLAPEMSHGCECSFGCCRHCSPPTAVWTAGRASSARCIRRRSRSRHGTASCGLASTVHSPWAATGTVR